MADRLYNILNFTGLAIGGTATLPHLLNIATTPVKPDRVDLQFPSSFELVSADTLVVTIRNISNGTGNCLAWIDAIHPAIRLLGGPPDDGNMVQSMVPRPFSQGPDSPGPPFPPGPGPVITTIYSRLTGNDTTGTGTLLNPYRTAQRNFRDLPALSPVPPGHQVVSDVTGIGTEAFPAGYQFPIMLAQVQGVTFGDPTTVPFLFSEAVCVRATPQPFGGIPLADTTVPGTDIVSIVDNADTNLATVTTATPRASWAADALKGQKIIGSGTDASTSCEIVGSDATHLQLANTRSAVFSTPQQDLFIVEPSAVFASAGPSDDGAGFECVGCTSIIFQGIGFTCVGGPGLLISDCPQPFMELCDVAGLQGFAIPQQFGVFSSHITDLVDFEECAISPRRSLFQGVSSVFFLCGGALAFRQTVFDTCAPIGPSTFATTEGGLIANAWEFFDVHFTASTGDAIFARGGGSWSFENVRFDGSGGDAIHAAGLTTVVVNHVTGATNTGAGVNAQDGASVRVVDNGTTVTGTAGDMLVGTLPARTWADFRANIPIKNQYDLQTPFITNVASGLSTPGGDDVTGAGTGGCSGSRLFQR